MKRTRWRVGSGLLRMLPVMGTQEGEFSDFSKEVGHRDACGMSLIHPLTRQKQNRKKETQTRKGLSALGHYIGKNNNSNKAQTQIPKFCIFQNKDHTLFRDNLHKSYKK